jgi:hypothetical protein
MPGNRMEKEMKGKKKESCAAPAIKPSRSKKPAHRNLKENIQRPII